MAKVAVASTDGVTINEHFGSAQEFLVYEVFDGGDFKFSERRTTPEGQSGHGNHGTAHLSASALEGVEAVLVSRIGPNATRILRYTPCPCPSKKPFKPMAESSSSYRTWLKIQRMSLPAAVTEAAAEKTVNNAAG